MSNDTVDPKQVFRLHDMSVEEVSVVDRAANRRKFLLVKREGDMGIGSEVVTNADGSLSAAKPAAVTPPAGEPTGTDTGASESAAKALPGDAKQSFVDVVEAALTGLGKAKALLASSADAEGVLDIVVKTADDLADSVFAFLGIEPDENNANLTKPAQTPEAPAGMGKRLEVRRAKRVIQKAEAEKLGTTFIAKVGAKMAKDRLDRLQAAFAALSDVINEVMPKVDTDKAKDGTPSAGLAEQKPGEKPAVAPSVPEKKKKGHSPEAQAALNKAASIIKSQAEQLGALRDSRQTSNGAPVEVQKARSQDVSWPLDMNDPINEASSGKEFFG